MTDTTTEQTKALERPFHDAAAILTKFIEQEAELRDDNDKGYDHTAAEAFLALQVMQDTVRGTFAIAQMAGKLLAEKDRRIRELILSNSRLKEISDKRRDRIEEIKAMTEFADLKTTPGEVAKALRDTHAKATAPIVLISDQVAL